MNWTHNDRTYEIADVDSLAIFYVVAADEPTMRGETFDRTAFEVKETLRLGQFKLLDTLAVPGAPSPFVGFFEAINGNRQVIGLKLAADAKTNGKKAKPAKQAKPTDSARSLHILGRALNTSQRGGPRQNAIDSDAAATPVVSTQPIASRLVERDSRDTNRPNTCPYLVTLITIGAEPSPARGSPTAGSTHRCEHSRTLAMTDTRLERLCRSTAHRSCRHYQFDPEHESAN